MPELDPFELRLARAVRALADGADTRVDAATMARQAVGRRPFWSVGWPAQRLPTPASMLLVVGLTVALYGGLLVAGGAPWGQPGLVAPSPSPTVAPPTAAPSPATSGVGNLHVTGAGAFAIISQGTTVQVGQTTQLRGFVATTSDRTSDPRVTGTGTLRLSIDSQGAVGREWGTYRLETADGVWEGAVTGADWSDGNESDVVGWLTGSGGYAGLTYFIDVRSSNLTTTIDGVIYSGTPPEP
ncbi:MAG: hypothetical protein HY263_04290 [Chloroflexi bacterium]|nr:hypothetical protein [Chloroflexota bacterium]